MVVIDKPSAEQQVGASLGTGLGNALQALVGHKVSQMQQKIHQQAFRGMGFTPQETQFLSMFPPEIQWKMFQQMGQMQQDQAQQQGALGSAVTNNTQPGQQLQQQGMQEALSQLGDPRDHRLQFAEGNQYLQPAGQQQVAQQQMTQPQQQSFNQPQARGLAQAIRQPLVTPQMKQQKELAEKAMAQKQDLADKNYKLAKKKFKLQQEQLEKKNKLEADKFQLEEKKEDRAIKTEAWKEETELRKEKQPFTDELRTNYKRSLQQKNSFESLIRDAQSGTLIAGVPHSLLKALHLENFWLNPSTQDAKKEIAGLATGVGSAFGKIGRILASEFEAYKSSLLTLRNTPEGITAIALNERLKTKIPRIEYKIYNDIIKENKGKVPANLEDLVTNRAKPYIKKIFKDMEANIAMARRDEMPEWGELHYDEKTGKNYKLNPANFPEGFKAELGGPRPWIIYKGMWLPVHGE